MCGIGVIAGEGWSQQDLDALERSQRHRGPDASGSLLLANGQVGFTHNRLSIIDLSSAGNQPMSTRDGRLTLTFNGEIYNYIELRRELSHFPYKSGNDAEVLLAAFDRWGPACLDRLVGMFAFVVWDEHNRVLFGARDRFGVKPLFYQHSRDKLIVASEIKGVLAAGSDPLPDEVTWASYLNYGLNGTDGRTFWRNVMEVPAGHEFTWRNQNFEINQWYDLKSAVAETDHREDDEVSQEYRNLMEEAVKLRFRSDVPVGICLSGGVDSSALLGNVLQLSDTTGGVAAYTFATGHTEYDETPWVKEMLNMTAVPLTVSELHVEEVPTLAHDLQRFEDEPYGGIPTIAYAKLFTLAREAGFRVLLDGQGMDEQWAGYDYYRGTPSYNASSRQAQIQGTKDSPFRPECLTTEFARLAQPLTNISSSLVDLQLRDLLQTKLPRALRFNDRASMRSSVELREPFLDHRLVELALRQPIERKIRGDVGKWLLRRIATGLMPRTLALAPKRALQTPQREWLRGPLSGWAWEQISIALDRWGGEWLDRGAVTQQWNQFCDGASDNSFYVWQWCSLGMMTDLTLGSRRP